jgi:hypothetical protein
VGRGIEGWFFGATGRAGCHQHPVRPHRFLGLLAIRAEPAAEKPAVSRNARSRQRSYNCYGEGNRFDVASGLPAEAGAGEVSAARGSSDS